jgi:hypothetical protein
MATPVETVPESSAPLSLADRCDACGAAAQVRAERPYKDRSELLFCGHHSAQHGPALLAQGWVIS